MQNSINSWGDRKKYFQTIWSVHSNLWTSEGITINQKVKLAENLTTCSIIYKSLRAQIEKK